MNKVKIITAGLFLTLSLSFAFLPVIALAEESANVTNLRAQITILLQIVELLRARLALLQNNGVVFQPSSGLSIASINPTTGTTGTQVTISGSGFTATGNKVSFGSTGSDNSPTYNLNSSDGRILTFSVPSTNYYACQYSTPACYPALVMVQPGTYSIYVTNANGKSNSATFTITSSGTTDNTVPNISYITPTTGDRYHEVTIVGSGFASTDNIKFGDTGTYISHNYIDSTKLTFTVPSALTNCNLSGTACTNLASPALVNGTYNIRVVNNNGLSNAVGFTVTGPQN